MADLKISQFSSSAIQVTDQIAVNRPGTGNLHVFVGSAALADVGTGIGDVVQLIDDGAGNPALPAVSGANLTDIVVTTMQVNDTSDSTCFFGLYESATGDLAPKSDTAATYDASTGIAGFTGMVLSGLTASQLIATDGSKNLVSLSTATYPSLTELSYVKGVSSALQTQIDTINTTLAQLDSAVVLKGSWDASAGSFPGSGSAQAGWSYIVSVAGTVDSTSFNIGDRIIAITDNASTTTFAANWFKADYTDQVLSVNTQTGAVVLNTSHISESGNLYFTDERAQDAVGGIFTDSAEIDFTYTDATPSITASIITGSISATKLDASVNASLVLADSATQPGDNISTLTNDSGFITASSSSTLTNKTIDAEGTGNTLSNIANSNIKAAAGILLSKTNISLTTTGSSGAATLNTTTGVLNIPQYAGGGTVNTIVAGDNIDVNSTDPANPVVSVDPAPIFDYVRAGTDGVGLFGLDGNFYTYIQSGDTMDTNSKILTLSLNNAHRSLTVAGDATISGTNTGDQTSVTGNAGTATALQTARNINGVSFNGTADITISAPIYPLMNYGGCTFDGSTNFLDGNALTGIADGKKGTFFAVLRFANSASATEEIIQNTGNAFAIGRTSTGNIRIIAENAAGTQIVSFATNDTPCAAAGTYAIMLSFDLATGGSGQIYINDVASALTTTTFTNDTIDYTVAEWSIGANAVGSNKFTGDMYSIWFDPTQNLNFSTESVRRKFIAANAVPIFLGAYGELPTGSSPILFLGYNTHVTWSTNRGTATTAFTTNGTLAAAGTALSGQYGEIGVKILQRKSSMLSTYDSIASGTSAFPYDNTPAQITEGKEFTTLVFTPQNANSTLLIELFGNFSHSNSNEVVGMALFVDATASALAQQYTNQVTSKMAPGYIAYEVLASSLTARTYRMRYGAATGTAYINGDSGGAKGSGLIPSGIRITEMR